MDPDRLSEIAEMIRQGADPEAFKEELDDLLGTEMADRDPVADATWEEVYRDDEGTESI
jgi:hypothetical protein